MHGLFDDVRIGVGDPDRVVAIVAFGVEDPGEKPTTPARRRGVRPGDNLIDALDVGTSMRADRLHASTLGGRRLKLEPVRGNSGFTQELLGTFEGFYIRKGQSKLVLHVIFFR